jgi:hypothetical protein
MLNSILETRTKYNGTYRITLRINENVYFLESYLLHRTDDGKPDKVKLRHNKREHIVIIEADLRYTDNAKTEGPDETNGSQQKHSQILH